MRVIRFKDIDKKKWNTAIHYAHNGNVFGYYWFLKAVLSEWDAIIKNDYEVVVPIFLSKLQAHQKSLLKELGPYSKSPLSDEIVYELLDKVRSHSKAIWYPINSSIKSSLLSDIRHTNISKAILPSGFDYLSISNGYADDVKEYLDTKGYEDVIISANLKPEVIQNYRDRTQSEKNALFRILHNAIYRGLCTSSEIKDKHSGKVLAQSFFINVNGKMLEIVTNNQGEKIHHQLLIDAILRTNYGAPISFESYTNLNNLQEMGYDMEEINQLQFKQSFGSMVKGLFKKRLLG